MPNPNYPVYVISKGRWESRLTVKALTSKNIPFHVVVEPQEYDNYASVIDPKNILTLHGSCKERKSATLTTK